jgi:hypothetical protein
MVGQAIMDIVRAVLWPVVDEEAAGFQPVEETRVRNGSDEFSAIGFNRHRARLGNFLV